MKYQFLSVITLVSLTACAQIGFVPDVPEQKQNISNEVVEDAIMPQTSKPFNQSLLETINATTDSSVTVYPLTGDITDPFTRKNLQPLSSKVVAEGYPVLDPSVTVFPIRPPSAIPPVSFENVNQTSAGSSLYSARVQSLTAQNDIEEGTFPNFPSSNSIVTSVESESLVPLPIKPMSELDFVDVQDRGTDFTAPPSIPVTPRAQQPVRNLDVFKKPGSVSRPEGSSGTYAPIVTSVSAGSGTISNFDEPWPITRPENTNMEALKSSLEPLRPSDFDMPPAQAPAKAQVPETAIVPVPMKPSIEKIDSDTNAAIPSLTGY